MPKGRLDYAYNIITKVVKDSMDEKYLLITLLIRIVLELLAWRISLLMKKKTTEHNTYETNNT